MNFSKPLFYAICLLSLVTCASNPENSTEMENGTILLSHDEKKSIVQALKKLDHKPVSERVALFHQLKKDAPDLYDFDNEDELNMYGYSLLWDNKPAEALEIFKLIVAEFPNSANAYDSLAEAYLAVGDKDASLVNYQKTLELNPDNFNAEDQIERILNPEIAYLTPAEKFVKVYDAQQYKDDLDQLGRTLRKVHPNALKFISEADFLQLIEDKKALINNQTTYAEFCWHCSEIVASVKCSHTSTGGFYPENEMIPVSLRFPVQVRWIQDRLYVVDPMNNSGKLAAKDEILTINGTEVSDIVRDIFKHIPAQGRIETSKKYALNASATSMIPFALDFPELYELTIAGKTGKIKLKPSETSSQPFQDQSIRRCRENLCLELLEDGKTAYMTISSFNYYSWNDLPVFQEFIDRSFTEINQKGIENLIIDVRFNGGGSAESSQYLLRHLVSEPFVYSSYTNYPGKKGIDDMEKSAMPSENRFKGKNYFIIDGIGNSTTGHFMSIVKVLNLGTIVGEELGSNQFCSAGQTICRLTNTKFVYYVANNTHISMAANSLPQDVGILPDYYVTQSIDDVFNRVDVVREFTIDLTEN